MSKNNSALDIIQKALVPERMTQRATISYTIKQVRSDCTNFPHDANFVTGPQSTRSFLTSLPSWGLCIHQNRWDHPVLPPLHFVGQHLQSYEPRNTPIWKLLGFLDDCFLSRSVCWCSWLNNIVGCCAGEVWQGKKVGYAFLITVRSSDGWKGLWNHLVGFCKPSVVCISLRSFSPRGPSSTLQLNDWISSSWVVPKAFHI